MLGPYCGDGHSDSAEKRATTARTCSTWGDRARLRARAACFRRAAATGSIDARFEQCDLGAGNTLGGYNGCTTSCTIGPLCGDGAVQSTAARRATTASTTVRTATLHARLRSRRRAAATACIQDEWGEQCDGGASCDCELPARACGNGVVDSRRAVRRRRERRRATASAPGCVSGRAAATASRHGARAVRRRRATTAATASARRAACSARTAATACPGQSSSATTASTTASTLPATPTALPPIAAATATFSRSGARPATTPWIRIAPIANRSASAATPSRNVSRRRVRRWRERRRLCAMRAANAGSDRAAATASFRRRRSSATRAPRATTAATASAGRAAARAVLRRRRVQNRPRVCDDGINDGTYGSCTPDCGALGPRCGDGDVQDGVG